MNKYILIIGILILCTGLVYGATITTTMNTKIKPIDVTKKYIKEDTKGTIKITEQYDTNGKRWLVIGRNK